MTALVRLFATAAVMAAGAATYLAVLAYFGPDADADLGLVLACIAAVCLAIAGIVLRAVHHDIDAALVYRLRAAARRAELDAEVARREGRRTDVLVKNVERNTLLEVVDELEHAHG